ncbi:Crp/Fnr family transcriptional regulator [Methylobacterium symbioticum]|uniref:Crp/Fnr family transcriptional regulator n=1 Tax=Methylobacterium symbioticum TaxID=2584084 RepID=UPI001FCF1277|nr:Crp/Fnr family transcriptional regulator [Methylobacterium symbioticum]
MIRRDSRAAAQSAGLPGGPELALHERALRLPPVPAPATGLSALTRVDRSHVLYWQGETAGKEIEIVEGVARAVHLCESGARQILTFFWPGTVICPSAGRLLCYTVETVTPCLFRIPPPDRPAAPNSGTDEHVLGELVHLLRGISRRCALSRVAWFLLRVREHLPRCGSEPEVLKLAIPRLDIADYLGLSLETVSRCLTELKGRGIIDAAQPQDHHLPQAGAPRAHRQRLSTAPGAPPREGLPETERPAPGAAPGDDPCQPLPAIPGPSSSPERPASSATMWRGGCSRTGCRSSGSTA